MAKFTTQYVVNMRFLGVDGVDSSSSISPTEIRTDRFVSNTGETAFYREIYTYIGNFTKESGPVSGAVHKIDYSGATFGSASEVWPARWAISDIDISLEVVLGPLQAALNAIFGGDDIIHGSSKSNPEATKYDDILYGYGGDDLIYGNGGKDLIDGGVGADIMVGGTGNTTYYVDNVRDAVVEFSGGGIDLVYSSIDHALAQFVDNLYLTGTAISGTGNDLNNVIQGTAGKNNLYGMDGRDTLFAGDGDDVLWGGHGADTLKGNAGIDTASYSQSTIGLTVSLQNRTLNTGEAAGDVYSSIENLRGSAYNDILQGNAAANALDGGNGNDVLEGGGGADALIGGGGTDTATYASSTKGVTASLSNIVINTNDAKGDTYSSIENLTGSAFADYLYGSSAANTISAGAGNDKLNGGTGNDRLAGGSGDDVFLFSSALNAATNVDTITDFKVADDAIWLSDAVFKGVAGGVLSSAAFRTGTAAADSSDRIIYDPSTGKVSYDPDGVGGHGAVQFALLVKGLAITHADFFVY